jgi:hypothetical protein
MPVRVKNSSTGAGSDSGKKPVCVQAPSLGNNFPGVIKIIVGLEDAKLLSVGTSPLRY